MIEPIRSLGPEVVTYTSLSKREYFAGLALSGIFANPEFSTLTADHASAMILDQVDSLIKMLEEKDKNEKPG
jgi:hypothetical protein